MSIHLWSGAWSFPTAGAALLAGWLAQTLAAPDGDVQRGIEAYEAGEHEAALGHFDAAKEHHGERPEIAFDRGLALVALGKPEEAEPAFQIASESETPALRASAYHALGNLAFSRSEWDVAIEHYIEALKARPDHENAKWNLELALQRKQQEEEKKQDEEKSDEEKQDEEKQDEEKSDEEKQDEEKQDEEKQDEEKQDEEKQDEEKSEDEQKQDEQKPEDEQKSEDEQKQDEQKSEQEQKQDEQQPQQQEPGEEQPPSPAERMNIERALEELDQQDSFSLDRPVGGRMTKPRKDW